MLSLVRLSPLLRQTLLAKAPFRGMAGRISPPISAARFQKKHAGTASMTEMTSITLGFILIVFSVLVLIWGFPNLPKR